MAAHGLAIAKIIGLVVLAMSAFAASTSSMLRGWGPSRSNVEKQRSHEQRSLLPLHVIVFLEVSCTNSASGVNEERLIARLYSAW